MLNECLENLDFGKTNLKPIGKMELGNGGFWRRRAWTSLLRKMEKEGI